MDFPLKPPFIPEEFEKKFLAPNVSDEEIMREVCNVNGVQYERINTEGPLADSIEIFFNGFPRFVPQLSEGFPNLICLSVVGQEVSVIENLSSLARLTELWIVECKLTKISGIKELRLLTRLYLYSNQITKIEGLSTLSRLESLWLNHNSISCIQGLENLKNLKELNLAENKIQSIGHSLDELVNLESLELSGNLISSFKDVTTLAKISKLVRLGLKDAKYPPNPICQLCNYTTHVLYHLPALVTLDGHDVVGKSYKTLAETTVIKKKMFYNMKLKQLQRNYYNFVKRLVEYKDQTLLKNVQERLTTLWQIYKQLQQDLIRVPREDVLGDVDHVLKDMDFKMSAVKTRITDLEKKFLEINQQADYYKWKCQSTLTSLVERLCLELESGGNIKLEIGTPNDLWFSSCLDLVLARFCAVDYKELGIKGVKVHRITRVYNRTLRMRFEEKLLTIKPDALSSEELAVRAQYIHDQTEYLFWVWDPELLGSKDQPNRILEEGFLDADSLQKLGKPGAVRLSNFLSVADINRISASVNSSSLMARSDNCPYRYGQLIVAKTFLGHSDMVKDTSNIKQELYPRINSVYKPRTNRPFEQFSSGVSAKVYRELLLQDQESTSKKCDCSQKQAEWFVFDSDFALPEYLVEFEYVTLLPSSSPFQHMDIINFGDADAPVTSRPPGGSSDDDVINMKPVATSTKCRVPALTEDYLLPYLLVDSLEFVTELNLNNQGLKKLSGMQQLVSLKTLILSFNELSKLDDLSFLGIETLDVSFNRITTLDGIKNMLSLKNLDVTWNLMRYIRDEFAILRKHAPSLEILSTQHNLWLKPQDFRLRVIARIKSLRVLDGIEITESEATAALRLAAGSRITQVQILSHGRTEVNKPRSLSLNASAKILSQSTKGMVDRLGESIPDVIWMAKVTSLCLDNQHIGKLSGLENLVNLRWASFCHNDIVKIEGLDGCVLLEELYLDDNAIYKFEGLQQLTNLKRLSLTDNYLVHIDPAQFDKLCHLHYLALDHNKMTSLATLQYCTALIELYISQNKISNIRDVFYLKACQNLLIVDISANPVNSTDNYRMFVIYHLSTLKALDGNPVEPNELGQARENLGGRLTSDFVIEKVGHTMFSEIRELDLPQLSLRSVDLNAAELFVNLRSINLEHNNLTNFGGLIHLPCLRVLCLNHNKIETVTAGRDKSTNDYSKDKLIPVLESLEVLHLGYNGIKDLAAVQISRLVGLKALFLQGNELQTVSGLDGLHDLRELVLDKNKIKAITESSFSSQWNLLELHIEENRLKELSNFHHLESLQRLYLGMNRIQDLSELEKLSSLTQLLELSLVSCPVSRRLMHRPLLVYRMPSLAVIDGIPVTEEEQLKANLYYTQQEQQQQGMQEPTQTLPGIAPTMAAVKGQVPVKVTNVSLGTFIEKVPWSGTLQFDPSILTIPDERVRPQKKNSPGQQKPGVQNFNIQATYANQGIGSQQMRNLFSDSNYSSNPFSKMNRKF